MRGAFATVLWIVCGLGILGAVVALIQSHETWDELGDSSGALDREPRTAPSPGSHAAVIERAAEIRQLLEARNARRERRGEPPLDVEVELRRLAAPPIDAELRAEIRDHVVRTRTSTDRHGSRAKR
jgi:hypothetical protein